MEQMLLLPDVLVSEENPTRGLYFIKHGILKVGKLGLTTRKFSGDILFEESLTDDTTEQLQVS